MTIMSRPSPAPTATAYPSGAITSNPAIAAAVASGGAERVITGQINSNYKTKVDDTNGVHFRHRGNCLGRLCDYVHHSVASGWDNDL